MNTLRILLALVMLFGASVCCNASSEFPDYEVEQFETFSDYFDFLVPYFERSMKASREDEAYQIFGYDSFDELKPYLQNDSKKVRWHALIHLWRFIQLESDVEKCQLMLSKMISCIENKDGSNDQWIAKRIIIFPREYFSTESQNKLIDFLSQEKWNSHTLKYLILALGIAHPNDGLELLKSRSPKQGWYSSLALARMGSAEHLKKILDEYSPDQKIETDNEFERAIYYSSRPRDRAYMIGLAYTRRDAAIDKLIDFAFRDDMQPGSDDYGASYFAGHAIGVLSMIIKEFPLENEWSGHNPQKIEECRKWLKKNYSKGRIRDMLNGKEVHGWR